jgi:hypothetical protein
MPLSPPQASCAALLPTSPPSQHASYAPPTPSPPQSCHPALLVEDEVASVYRATIYTDFHKSLCERPHQVLLSQRRQRQRQTSPDPDSIVTFARPAIDQHIHHAPIRDTVARQPSPADQPCLKHCRASERNDEQNAPSKQPRHLRPSAKPRKSTARHDAYQSPLMLPDRSNTVLPVSEADETFSWWRPLTPSPPKTPKSQSVTALVMTGLRQPITDVEPHIQIPATCASDDGSIHVPGNAYNSSNDTRAY